MMTLLLVALLGSAVLQPDPGAVERFYDRAGTGTAPMGLPQAKGRLREIPELRQFVNANVGIHYWFQDETGARLTEEQAAERTERAYMLHIRGNVDAFLTVWLVSDDGGRELTPVQGRYSGYLLPLGTEYVVAAPLRFTENSTRRVILVFSRSQTEQVVDAAQALKRLEDISARKTPDGSPQLVRGTDATTAGQLGTYVVNRRGAPLAAAISLRSK